MNRSIPRLLQALLIIAVASSSLALAEDANTPKINTRAVTLNFILPPKPESLICTVSVLYLSPTWPPVMSQ